MSYVLTITGASGSGKDTLMNTLLCLNGHPTTAPATNFANMFYGLQTTTRFQFKPLVSHTTRAKRDGEKQDVTYHYVSDEEFDKTDMLELVEYAGHRYGLSLNEVESLGKNEVGIVIVEPHGRDQIRSELYDSEDIKVLSVFLAIDEDTSMNHLMARNTGMADVNRRLEQHRMLEEYTPHGYYDLVLTNNNVKDFCYNVVAITNLLKEIERNGT